MRHRSGLAPLAGVIALAICVPAAAQTTGASVDPQAIFEAWQNLMSAQKALMDRLPPAETAADGLLRRAALRGLGGDARIWISGSNLSTEDRVKLNRQIWDEMAKLNADDTAYLKSILPADGWFRKSRDGAEASDSALDILQGSKDEAFRQEALKAMEPLVKLGEVDGQSFAGFVDMTETRAGRLQRYGTLARCEDGRLSIMPVADPSKVDELRRSVGLPQTYAAYAASVKDKRC